MTSSHASEAGPAPIRVLIADLPRTLVEVVTRLMEQQPDMALVGQVEGPVDLLLAVRRGVDVVMLGAAQVEPPPGVCSHLLSEHPDLRIVVLAASGDTAAIYWLGLRRQRLAEVSSTDLVRT